MRVFVNGCFDVLHVGHIRLFKAAAMLGELTVALNSDRSIQRLKGEQRPINTLSHRIEMIDALECVTKVESFEEESPKKLLEKLYKFGVGPHIVLKGTEYAEARTIDEKDLVHANGGIFLFYNSYVEVSSTSIHKSLHVFHEDYPPMKEKK